MLKCSECRNKTFLVEGAAGSPKRKGIKSIREAAPVTRPLFGLENVRAKWRCDPLLPGPSCDFTGATKEGAEERRKMQQDAEKKGKWDEN